MDKNQMFGVWELSFICSFMEDTRLVETIRTKFLEELELELMPPTINIRMLIS
jgi:hypothetical protein